MSNSKLQTILSFLLALTAMPAPRMLMILSENWTLTNGRGGTLIRQWKPYPEFLVGGGDFQPLNVPRI